MVLLLVDGKRSAVELRQMMANATPEALRSLLDEGYIAPTSRTCPQAPFVDRFANGVSLAGRRPIRCSRPRRCPAASTSHRGPNTKRRRTSQRAQIERSLRRALGPTADSLIETVRKARTVRDLVEVLKTAQRAITNARGKDIGDEFASRYGSLDDL